MGRNEKRVRIFSALEVANLCGVVNQTAINWIKTGHLKAFTTPGGQFRIYAEDLIAFSKQHLAGFKVPRHIVFAELPKTSTGKIQKHVLRSQAKEA